MDVLKRFHVFGEPIEVLLSGEMSNGLLTVITQTCEPGGGPPPHSHANEDEIFTVPGGEFEVFDGVHCFSKTELFRDAGRSSSRVVAIFV